MFGGILAPLPGGTSGGTGVSGIAGPVDALVSKATVDSNKSMGNALDAIRGQVGPEVESTHPVEHGDTLIDAYKAKDAAVKADVTAKYQAAKDANGGNLQMEGGSFVNDAEAALKPQGKGKFLPATVRGILDDVKDSNGQMSLDDFEGYKNSVI